MIKSRQRGASVFIWNVSEKKVAPVLPTPLLGVDVQVIGKGLRSRPYLGPPCIKLSLEPV